MLAGEGGEVECAALESSCWVCGQLCSSVLGYPAFAAKPLLTKSNDQHISGLLSFGLHLVKLHCAFSSNDSHIRFRPKLVFLGQAAYTGTIQAAHIVQLTLYIISNKSVQLIFFDSIQPVPLSKFPSTGWNLVILKLIFHFAEVCFWSVNCDLPSDTPRDPCTCISTFSEDKQPNCSHLHCFPEQINISWIGNTIRLKSHCLDSKLKKNALQTFLPASLGICRKSWVQVKPFIICVSATKQLSIARFETLLCNILVLLQPFSKVHLWQLWDV